AAMDSNYVRTAIAVEIAKQESTGRVRPRAEESPLGIASGREIPRCTGGEKQVRNAVAVEVANPEEGTGIAKRRGAVGELIVIVDHLGSMGIGSDGYRCLGHVGSVVEEGNAGVADIMKVNYTSAA